MIYILILAFVVLALIVAVIGRKNEEAAYGAEVPQEFQDANIFMSSEAIALCEALKKQLQEHYLIFTNVRMEDFIHMIQKADPSQKFSVRKRMKSTFVDFLICDKNMRPMVAVELDEELDSSRIKKNDKYKDDVYHHIGLPIMRIRVGSIFSTEVQKVSDILQGASHMKK